MKDGFIPLSEHNFEKWSSIDGYGNEYAVSNHGRVMSFKGNKPRVLSCPTNNSGYRYFIACKGGKRKALFVHREVATAFVENPNEYDMVLHNNGKKTDNYYTNLRWGNANQNSQDMIEHGNSQYGENNFNSKLSVKEVKEIRSEEGLSQKEMADKYGVSQATISHIINRVTWTRTRGCSRADQT